MLVSIFCMSLLLLLWAVALGSVASTSGGEPDALATRLKSLEVAVSDAADLEEEDAAGLEEDDDEEEDEEEEDPGPGDGVGPTLTTTYCYLKPSYVGKYQWSKVGTEPKHRGECTNDCTDPKSQSQELIGGENACPAGQSCCLKDRELRVDFVCKGLCAKACHDLIADKHRYQTDFTGFCLGNNEEMCCKQAEVLADPAEADKRTKAEAPKVDTAVAGGTTLSDADEPATFGFEPGNSSDGIVEGTNVLLTQYYGIVGIVGKPAKTEGSVYVHVANYFSPDGETQLTDTSVEKEHLRVLNDPSLESVCETKTIKATVENADIYASTDFERGEMNNMLKWGDFRKDQKYTGGEPRTRISGDRVQIVKVADSIRNVISNVLHSKDLSNLKTTGQEFHKGDEVQVRKGIEVVWKTPGSSGKELKTAYILCPQTVKEKLESMLGGGYKQKQERMKFYKEVSARKYPLFFLVKKEDIQ